MNENLRIDFNRPAPVGKELEYIAEAVHSGHISGMVPLPKNATPCLNTNSTCQKFY